MLSSENVREIDRIFMRNGGGKDVVAKVARQYGITESFAGSIAKALVEKRGPNVPDIVTESATATSTPPTAKLQTQVQEAEALRERSLQELQTDCAEWGAARGMFGG